MLRYFLLALAAFPALCADWNPRLAADYLDSRQREWFAWAPAKAPGGPCVSCHTGATYLLARPALRRALGENQPALYETGLLDGLAARVEKTEAKDAKQAEPWLMPEPRLLKPIRVGLYDQYGGLMPSGWTRWLFEQFEFPFEVVYPQTVDAGSLRARFDVLVFPDGAMRRAAGPAPETIPAEDRGWLGRITEEKTVPLIMQFVESGGSVVTVGGATSLAPLLGVPIQPAISLPREKFYIPGSLMRAKIDNTHPLAYGMPSEVNVFFDESPVFKPLTAATSVAWFAGKETLTSGWAHGQEYLDGAVAVAEAKVGEGRVFIMGPEVTFRGEPHGTFKLMFNALYYGSAQAAVLK